MTYCIMHSNVARPLVMYSQLYSDGSYSQEENTGSYVMDMNICV